MTSCALILHSALFCLCIRAAAESGFLFTADIFCDRIDLKQKKLKRSLFFHKKYVIIKCQNIILQIVLRTALLKGMFIMEYSFSKKVSHLQASAIREILKFTSDPEVISFAAGNPAPEAFPVDTLKSLSAEIFEEDPILALQYSVTEGYTPLRNELKKRLEKDGIFDPKTDELIITSGAQQANELTAKVLCDEGGYSCV